MLTGLKKRTPGNTAQLLPLNINFRKPLNLLDLIRKDGK